jgi:hypothetical protein
LVDIIRQTQWPEIEAGTSLAHLKEFLDSNGIYTLAVETHRLPSLPCEYPAIVHLNPDTGHRGHFVVLLPADRDADATVWNGLAGFQTVARRDIEARMSGLVLLTAPAPLDVHMLQSAQRRSFLNNSVLFFGGFTIVAVPALWGLRRSRIVSDKGADDV